MLVLSRKVGDRIHIGPDVAITIVKLSGGTVRIGVEAPPHAEDGQAHLKNFCHIVTLHTIPREWLLVPGT